MARKTKPKTLPTDLSASEHEHNELVAFEVSCLMAWDGNPATEGAEWYAPEGWSEAAHKAANGMEADAPLLDGDKRVIVIEDSWFACPRITAEALERAGLGQIAT